MSPKRSEAVFFRKPYCSSITNIWKSPFFFFKHEPNHPPPPGGSISQVAAGIKLLDIIAGLESVHLLAEIHHVSWGAGLPSLKLTAKAPENGWLED